MVLGHPALEFLLAINFQNFAYATLYAEVENPTIVLQKCISFSLSEFTI